jgi:hypothetical protein
MTAAPEQVQVTQADIARALKHLGFDSVEDLHYWVMDDSELSRFDALCLQLAEHRHTATADALELYREAREALSGVIQSASGTLVGGSDGQTFAVTPPSGKSLKSASDAFTRLTAAIATLEGDTK